MERSPHGALTIGVVLIVMSAALSAFTTRVDAAHTIDSVATTDRIRLDGDPEDWQGLPSLYLEDSLRVVAVAHDNENLYLMYRFGDERLARQLLDRGVLLWFNGNGKHKKKDEAYGIRYAGSAQIREYLANAPRPGPGRAGRDAPDVPPVPGQLREHLAQVMPAPGHITVVRLGLKEVAPSDSATGLAAASAAADGTFCYELRIPLADIGGKVAGQPASKRRRLAVGIEIEGLTEAEREYIQSAMREARGERPQGPGRGGSGMGGRGGMGGLGGGPPGMGGGGGRHGGRGEGMRRPFDPATEWLTVVLAPSS